MTRALVRWAHRRLLQHYGRPTWESSYAPLEELIGTILSQHTSDVNSQRAFDALTAAFSTWEAVRDAPVEQLTQTIRSGGLAVVKAHRIQAVLRALTGADGNVELGLVPARTTPEATTETLEAALEPREYYAFHVNLIRLGREICKAPRPRCGVCPLVAQCRGRLELEVGIGVSHEQVF